MSIFECAEGHQMTGYVCKICGGRVKYMDGETSRQIRMREAYEADLEREEREKEIDRRWAEIEAEVNRESEE